jgi:hypothetical protein
MLPMRPLLFLLALSLVPARAGAEGATLSSEKVGACALLTAADAQRFANVPMAVEVGAPGRDSPGRNCAYRPVQPGAGRGTVQLRLLDARQWSRLAPESGAGKPEVEGVNGIGDQAYVVRNKSNRRAGALVLFVRRGSSQFSVRFAGAGRQLTEPMKQLARIVVGRL